MIEKRRIKYLELVESGSISLFYAGLKKQKTHDQHYPFVVNRNFFYLTNIDQDNVVLVLIKGNNKVDSFLFLEETDELTALWDGAGLTFAEASNLSGIKEANIRNINTLDAFLSSQLSLTRQNQFGVVNRLYFDIEMVLKTKYLTPTEINANNYKMMYPHLNVLNSNPILSNLRMVKDGLEINNVKKAISITKDALNHLMKTIKPRMNEYEVLAEYRYALNLQNVSESFDTIVASGKNATILHYVDNNQVINDGDLLLLDLGVNYKNYASDISRTYPVNGKFSERQKQIYEIVLKANKESIKMLKPGISIKEFNDFGKNILTSGLKEIGLIKEDHEISKYYYHSLGHYLGLDVHDVANYNELIPVGAIITVEPGLYIAEENIGIRIEDNILITEDGNINLSEALIKEVKDIEQYMK